jgi:2-haloacid dehalogenase
MSKVIVFDVNETLLDLSPLEPQFRRLFGRADVMHGWFRSLLHSSLVATLVDTYSDFGALAGAALDLVASQQRVRLTDADRREVLDTMKQLPPHPEARRGIERLLAAGFRLATLTNSPEPMLAAQMSNSGLGDLFERLLSVDQVRKFKPAPEPYRMAAKELGVEIGQIRLVAAHDWDVYGALSAGCRGAYIARQGKAYHPLYEKPDITGRDLVDVADQIVQMDGAEGEK